MIDLKMKTTADARGRVSLSRFGIQPHQELYVGWSTVSGPLVVTLSPDPDATTSANIGQALPVGTSITVLISTGETIRGKVHSIGSKDFYLTPVGADFVRRVSWGEVSVISQISTEEGEG